MAQFMDKNQQVEKQQHFQKYKNGFQNRHSLYGLIPTWDAPEYSRLQASVKPKGASELQRSWPPVATLLPSVWLSLALFPLAKSVSICVQSVVRKQKGGPIWPPD